MLVWRIARAPYTSLDGEVEPADVPDDLRLLGIELPDDLEPKALSLTLLPRDWQTMPAPTSTQAIGNAWLATGTSALLVVPSIVMQHEQNYLVNPAHPDA